VGIPAQLSTHLVSAMGEAFDMMIGKPVEFQTSGPELPAGWRAHVAASVAFAGIAMAACAFTAPRTVPGPLLEVCSASIPPR
jgi:hypothetical protein